MKKILLVILGLFGGVLLAANLSSAQEVETEEINDENAVVQEEIGIEDERTTDFNDYEIEDLNGYEIGEVEGARTAISSSLNRTSAYPLLAWMFGFGGIILLIAFILLICILVGLWKICKKAGRKGWEGILPIYNLFVLWDIAGLKKYVWAPGALILIVFAGGLMDSPIPYLDTLINIFGRVVSIALNYNLARKFGWSTFGGVMCVIFSGICYIILGLGSSEYQGEDQTIE